jgi:hypothetical protein
MAKCHATVEEGKRLAAAAGTWAVYKPRKSFGRTKCQNKLEGQNAKMNWTDKMSKRKEEGIGVKNL